MGPWATEGHPHTVANAGGLHPRQLATHLTPASHRMHCRPPAVSHTPLDERVTPTSTELANEQNMEVNPSFAGAVHCLQAPAVLAVLCAKLWAFDASVGEARLRG
jgi:hypothetical protein